MLVESRSLSKVYRTPRGEIAAVADLDLTVEAGEFLAVCGRSGSGKSTLLGMLGGLCRPSKGSVRIDGADLWSLRPGALADFRACRFGFMFQFAGLLPNLRAIDNIALPALLGGVDYTDAYDRARDLLEQVGLSDRWDAYAGELSGGQQRRVALARALVNEPVLLLADEPTNDLDEQAEHEVLGLLRRLHRVHGTTMIVVTHDPQLARRADRVIHLRGGTLASVVRPGSPALPEPPPAAPAASAPDPPPAGTEPTPLGAGLVRFVVGFIGWSVLIAGVLGGVDLATAHFQRRALEDRREGRERARELALQQLRADVEDVTYRPGGAYEVGVALQNYDVHKPFYVLGPSARVYVQRDRNWHELPAAAVGFSDNGVHEVTRKRVFRFSFDANIDRHDELLKGYMHVRISNVMVVGERAEPGPDLFQRTDDYYVYLKPQKVTDDEVRRRNGWTAKALVPRWIGMPAH
jgi:putative ABC transport system ATP-binding protein/macrolide transport system ATP-binding/permease protein/lipoprotein-releasing system ATP-binding protein